MLLSTLSVAAFVVSVFGANIPSTHKLHEKRDAVPDHFIKGKELHPSQLLPVRIGMTQQRLDDGHDLLMELSDHKSPKYGQWYSTEEIADLFAPSQSAVDTIRDWLHESGIDAERVSQSWNKQWMQFDATVGELSKLLKTKYHSYTHTPTGSEHPACDEYHVPGHIQEHVDYITPGIKLFQPTRVKQSGDVTHVEVDMEKRQIHHGPVGMKPLPIPISKILSGTLIDICGIAITPACIAAMYKIPAAPLNPVKDNNLGIFEDIGDHYSPTDLTLFFALFATNIPLGERPINNLIDGATGPASIVLGAGPESDLDFQISYPIIYPQRPVLFQTDDDVYENKYTFTGLFNNFFDAIDGSYCHFTKFGASSPAPQDPQYPHNATGGFSGQLQCGKYKPTNVISMSYGGQEPGVPVSYQRRQCAEIMKLGMQGISVLVASGDSGVGGSAGCITKGKDPNIFNPDFPASCPYITSVGATTLPKGANPKTDQETAVTQFGSGGGFSNIYAIPSYQKSHVHSYLTKHKPPYQSYETIHSQSIGPGSFNRAGRGYPDVAAIGQNVVIFNKGLPTLIGGTSAASPTFAAILTRINEERLKAGKKTIGFVNPMLYAHPEVLNDVTKGTNPGCTTQGFSCSEGWDPVTGLGTPNYEKMLKLFMSMP